MDTVYTCPCGNQRIHKPNAFHTCNLPMCCGKLMAVHECMGTLAIQAEVMDRWYQSPAQSNERDYWWEMYGNLATLHDHNYPAHIERIRNKLSYAEGPVLIRVLQETLTMLEGTKEEKCTL